MPPLRYYLRHRAMKEQTFPVKLHMILQPRLSGHRDGCHTAVRGASCNKLGRKVIPISGTGATPLRSTSQRMGLSRITNGSDQPYYRGKDRQYVHGSCPSFEAHQLRGFFLFAFQRSLFRLSVAVSRIQKVLFRVSPTLPLSSFFFLLLNSFSSWLANI
jgi:hypothetical protein